MRTISFAISTSELNYIRQKQSAIIKRAYGYAKKGLNNKSIFERISSDIDDHLIRSGIQKGIDLFSATSKDKKDKKVIFGGRKNFIRRCKNLITKTEWKQLRILPIYSIGQANNKGNRRFRIDYESRKLFYSDANKNKFVFDIPTLKPNWEFILEEIANKAENKNIALTFSVSENKVDITYDETLLDYYKKKYVAYKVNKFRYLGIDLNPNRIGVSVYDTRQQDTIYSEQYELISKDQNKRKNEISHICQAIAKLMKHYQVFRVGMEDLTIKTKNHGKGKRFNKLVNMWIRNFIQGKIRMICNLYGIQFCSLNAAYSSFVGTLRNPDLGDCCGAASELARRCGYKSTGFYPKLISNDVLVHRWKEMAGIEVLTWVDLYEEFKKRRLGWRSSPRGSRSSKFGTWSERLLVYQTGVSLS